MTVEPYDEEDIDDNDTIIRRVNPEQHVIPDENTGQRRISSKLFSPSSSPNGGMSVDILKLIEASGQEATDFIRTPPFIGSVAFSASSAREVGLRIGYDPIPDNPFHGEVWGSPGRPQRFSQSQKRALQQASTWFVEIPGVDITKRS